MTLHDVGTGISVHLAWGFTRSVAQIIKRTLHAEDISMNVSRVKGHPIIAGISVLPPAFPAWEARAINWIR